jgi:hypothetical protein
MSFNCGDGASDGDNDVDLKADKLGCDLGVALGAALRPAILDRDGTTLNPAEFVQARFASTSLFKAVKPRRIFRQNTLSQF